MTNPPVFLPPAEKLVHDISKVTNLCYYAPIDAYRRKGWGTEVLYGERPRAYRGTLSYEGQGTTYAARILDLVQWLEEHN